MVRSVFSILCCLVWLEQRATFRTMIPTRVLTIMQNAQFFQTLTRFIISISLSCTATIKMLVITISIWCMNMSPTAPSTASSMTTAIEPSAGLSIMLKLASVLVPFSLTCGCTLVKVFSNIKSADFGWQISQPGQFCTK